MNCSTTENEILFFVMLSCTPDIGRQEQVSGFVRIVSIHEAATKLKENFP
jgi:hypothetical protein